MRIETDKESSATAGLMQMTDANVNSEEMPVHRLDPAYNPVLQKYQRWNGWAVDIPQSILESMVLSPFLPFRTVLKVANPGNTTTTSEKKVIVEHHDNEDDDKKDEEPLQPTFTDLVEQR